MSSSNGQLPSLNTALSPAKKSAQKSAVSRRPTKRETLIKDSPNNVVAKTTEARRRVLEVFEYEIRPQLRERVISDNGKESFLPDTPEAQEALTHLVQELVFLFIATFHQDSMASWRILLESLLHVQPVCVRLQEYPQIEHYLRRVRYHASVKVERTFMMRVLDIVAKLFPDVAGNVALENSSRFSERNNSPRRLHTSRTGRSFPADKSADFFYKGTALKSPNLSAPSINRIITNQGLPLTGKDAIEYFRKPDQGSSCKIFYLVQRSPPQYDPYDVVAVPKAKVVQNPQPYYLVTKNEIVFMDEDGTNERWSHDEWLRDAESFYLLTQLPTFKYFLLREAFIRWKNYSCSVHEQRWKRELTSNLLLASTQLVLPLQFMMRAMSSISDLQIIRLNADEDPTVYIQQKCLTLRPTLSRALMDIQSSLAMARTQVLASFETYRKFRKHPALRKLKQSLYLSKEDTMRKKQLLSLASKVERMHNLAFHKTSSHVSELLEKSFTAAQHGPPFSCSLALRKGIDSSETDLQERIFLEADLSRLREKLSSVVQTLTHAVAETLIECEIRNKHNLMFSVDQQLSPNSGPSASLRGEGTNLPPPVASSSSLVVDPTEVDLPECFTSYQSFMSRLAKQISGSHVVKRNLKLIDDKLDAATDYVNGFVEESSLKSMVQFLDRTDTEQFTKFFNSGESKEIIDEIGRWNYLLTTKLPDSFITQPPVLIVSCKAVREKLSSQLAIFLSRITDNAKLFVVQKSIPLNRTLSDILQELKWKENSSWSEYIDFYYKYNESLDSSFLLLKEIKTLESYFSIMCCLQSELPEDVDRIHRDIHYLWHSLVYSIRSCKAFLERNREPMMISMEVAYKGAMAEMDVCLSDVSQGIFVSDLSDFEEIQKHYSQISKRFVDSKNSCAKIGQWKIDTPGVKLSLPDTEDKSRRFYARGELWNEYNCTLRMDTKWLTMKLTPELLTDVETQAEKWHQRADSLHPLLPENDLVLLTWQTKVDYWKKLKPLLRDLLSSVQDECDWKIILNGLVSDKNGPSPAIPPSVGYLTQIGGFGEHGEWVSLICQFMSRKKGVETLMDQIIMFWFSSRLITSRSTPPAGRNRSPQKRLRDNRGSHGQVSNSFQEVPVGIINIYSLRSKVQNDILRLKSYQHIVFQELKQRINVTLSFLSLISGLLKFLYEFQSKFQLLQKYLPPLKTQEDAFILVIQSFRIIMEWLANHSFLVCHIAIPKYLVTRDNLTGWLESHPTEEEHRICQLPGNYTLLSKLTSLEVEQNTLIAYLEEFIDKDVSNFPRLYTLSQPERMDFYSQTAQDFFSVYDSPYLRRCFPAIHKITVTKDSFANTWLIRIHADGESLDIPEAPATGSTLAHWLSSFQLATSRYLRRTLSQGGSELTQITNYSTLVTSALKYESFPVQIVLLVGGLWWTKKMSDALESRKKQKLEELNLEFQVARKFLIGKIQKHSRESHHVASVNKVEGLLYQVDYYQNIVGETDNNNTERDFRWKQALQFLPVKNSGQAIQDVLVSVLDVAHNYGYSYVGPSVSSSFMAPLLEKSLVLFALEFKRGRNWPKLTNRTEKFNRQQIENVAKILGRTTFRLPSSGDGQFLERFNRYLISVMMDGSWLLMDSMEKISSGDMESVRNHLKHVCRCLDIHDLRSKNKSGDDSPVSLDFNGRTLTVHPDFSFAFISANDQSLVEKDITRLRLVGLCEPDWSLVIEAGLRARGFTTQLTGLSQQIRDFLIQYKEEIVPNRNFVSQMHIFLKLTYRSYTDLQENNYGLSNLTPVEMEETAIQRVLSSRFISTILNENLRAKFSSTMLNAFPNAKFDLETMPNADWLLRSRIKETLAEMGVDANATFIDKCIELYNVICSNRLVLLSGPPSSGKTLSCRALVRALCNYEDETSPDVPKINFEHSFPGSWKLKDFEQWILDYKFVRWKCSSDGENHDQEWLLLDGEADHSWFNSACFRDFCMDFSHFERGCLLLEIGQFAQDNDSGFLDNWTEVNFSLSGLDWTSLLNGFLQQLPMGNPISLLEVEKLRLWLYQLIPKASQFVASVILDFKERNWAVSETNRLTSTFLKMYDAVIWHFYHSETDVGQKNSKTEEYLCGPLIYALLWGFAGSIDFQCQNDRREFETRFRQCLSSCSPSLEHFLPKDETFSAQNYSLFDYHIVPLTGTWERPTTMLTLDVRGKIKGSVSTNNSCYVGEGLTAGIRSIVSILRSNGTPTLLTGGYGVGKTALFKYLQNNDTGSNTPCCFLGTSSGTNAEDFRQAFLKKSSLPSQESSYSINERLAIMVDDLHLAGKSYTLGDSSAREWIRSALLNPGLGSVTISAVTDYSFSPRMSRQLVKIQLPSPDANLLTSCYGKALDCWLTPSTRGYALLAALNVTQALIEATLDFHHSFLNRVQSSQKSLYSWHHVHRVFKKLVSVDTVGEEKITVSIPAIWCLVVDCVYCLSSSKGDRWNKDLFELIKQTARLKFSNSKTPNLYPSSSNKGSPIYVTIDRSSSSVNDDFESVLDVTKNHFVLVPDVYSKRTTLKPISTSFSSDEALFLPIQKTIVSRLTQSLVFPDGHAVLTSDERWVGKETSALGVGKRLGWHVVTINYPSDHLEIPQNQKDASSLLDQSSDTMNWDNLWKLSSRSRTASKSAKLPPISQNHRKLSTSSIASVISPHPKSGIPVLVTKDVKRNGRDQKLQKNSQPKVKGNSSITEKLQECLHKAGVKGDPVLMIVNISSWNENDDGQNWLLDTVQSLVLHGDCSWLRILRNSDHVLHYMQLLFLSEHERDRNFLYSRFTIRVRKNLHVLLLAQSEIVGKIFENYPFSSHISGFIKIEPWNTYDWNQYGKIICRDLQDKIDESTIGFLKKVHITLREKIGHQIHPTNLGRAVYWAHFLQDHFNRVVDDGTTWEKGLSALSKFHSSLSDLDGQMEPLHEENGVVDAKIESCEDSIVVCEDEYAMLQDHCATFEEDLRHFKQHLEQAQTETRRLLRDSQPIYQHALNQLLMLIPSRLQELKSYRAPPVAVTKVLGAFCLLFKIPQNVDSAKQYIMSEYLPALLQQFNWENIPEDIYLELRKLVDEPSFTVELVAQSSEAAAALWRWICAVNSFLKIKYSHKELYGEMMESETLIKNKEDALKRDRSTLEAVENELNSRRQELQELVSARTKISERISYLQQEAEVFRQILYAARWAEDRWTSQAKRREKPSKESSLIFVIELVYSSLSSSGGLKMSELDINALLTESGMDSITEKSLNTVVDFFLSGDIQSYLMTEGVPADTETLTSLLSLAFHLQGETSLNCALLYDPYGYATKWIQLSWDINYKQKKHGAAVGELNLVTFFGDDPKLIQSIRELDSSPGTVILISDAQYLHTRHVATLLQSFQNQILISSKKRFNPKDLTSFSKEFWKLPVFEVGCARTKGLVEVFTHKLLQSRHPNLFRQIRELEDLMSVRCQEAERAEEEVIACFYNNNTWTLERLEEISKRQDQIAIRMSKLETQTEHELLPHKEVASRIIILANQVLPALKSEVPGLNLSSSWIFNSACDLQYDEDIEIKTNANANAVIAQRHFWAVFRSLFDFFNNQRIENLIYNLSIENAHDQNLINKQEREALIGNKLGHQFMSYKDKPSWLTTQEWIRIDALGSLFPEEFVTDLKRSLTNEGGEDLWKPYREESFSSTSFPPLKIFTPLTLTQSVLLKCAVCYKQLSQIRWALSSVFLGSIAEQCRKFLVSSPPRPNLKSLIQKPGIPLIVVYFDGKSKNEIISPTDEIISLQRDVNVMTFTCKLGRKSVETLISAINTVTTEGMWLIVQESHRITWTPNIVQTFRQAVETAQTDIKLWLLADIDKVQTLPDFLDLHPKIMLHV